MIASKVIRSNVQGSGVQRFGLIGVILGLFPLVSQKDSSFRLLKS
jgi:hypothetical protein